MRALIVSRARRRAAAALLSLLVLAVGLFGSVAPAGAYYGEIEGYVTFSFSASARGCAMGFLVQYARTVQVYCDMQPDGQQFTIGKTNYYEYPCWQWDGCYYEVYISGWNGYHSVGVYTMKKDNYGGQHALIYWARNWAP